MTLHGLTGDLRQGRTGTRHSPKVKKYCGLAKAFPPRVAGAISPLERNSLPVKTDCISVVRLRNCHVGFALTPTLSQGEREPSNPLALWERVAEGRVRAAGPTFFVRQRLVQKSNRTTLSLHRVNEHFGVSQARLPEPNFDNASADSERRETFERSRFSTDC